MLEVSIPIAYELLAQCIKQGQALVQRASLVGDFSDYESWKAARSQWIDPTVQALEHMYGGPTEAREFADAATCPEGSKRWQEQYGADLKCVKEAIDFLTVLQGELAFENGSRPPAPGDLVSASVALFAGDEARSADRDESQAAPQNRGDLASDVVELQTRDVKARDERPSEHSPTSGHESFAERSREPDAESASTESEREREREDEHDRVDAQPFSAPRSNESPAE